MYVDTSSVTTNIVESNGFKVALIVASIIIVLIGIYPYPFFQFATNAASSFLAHG